MKTLADQFWGKVDRTGDCWLWTGNINSDGYGRIGVNYKNILAHRFSWGLHFGMIPKGMNVLHECDNPPCVNPAHLFLGTQADNMKDMVAKGRSHTAFKLTVYDVREIRRRAATGENQTDIGTDFGLCQGTVSEIFNRKIWKHIQ